jgi:hypothetical protein
MLERVGWKAEFLKKKPAPEGKRGRVPLTRKEKRSSEALDEGVRKAKVSRQTRLTDMALGKSGSTASASKSTASASKSRADTASESEDLESEGQEWEGQESGLDSEGEESESGDSELEAEESRLSNALHDLKIMHHDA